MTRDFENSTDDWALSRPIYDPGDPRNSSQTIFALRERASEFVQINNSECMEYYSDPLSATAELLLVTNETSIDHNGTSMFGGWVSGAHSQRWEASTGWICSGHNGTPWTRYCSLNWALEFHDHWNFSTAWAGSFQNEWDRIHDREPADHTVYVNHCLMGKKADSLQTRCGLHYNFHLLILIVAITAIDTLLICCVAAAHSEPTLVVLGDAVAEALKMRDDHGTSGSEVLPQSRDRVATSNKFLAVSRWPDKPYPRWFMAVSLRIWIISLSLYVQTFRPVHLVC